MENRFNIYIFFFVENKCFFCKIIEKDIIFFILLVT